MNSQFKILYALQGTGNGHVARARELIPLLQKYGKLDVLLSGDQSEVSLPVQPKYRSKGLTFIYNRHGGISYWRTLFKSNLIHIIRDLCTFPVQDYDLVINDFEFISAWACKLRKINCYGLRPPGLFLSPNTPRPKKRKWLGECILKYYAPCSHPVGFHFDHFDNFIYKPVIRSEIRKAQVTNQGHYTVYLPAFSDGKIHRFLSQIPGTKWEVFSKNTQKAYQRDNLFFPISNGAFVNSLVSCEGVFTSAGIETPAEALYMGKKVMVIPIKGQYEQFCNAAAIQKIGVPVIYKFDERALIQLRSWVLCASPLNIQYPNLSEKVIYDQIIAPNFKSMNH
ncbi:MAG: glycosyltransferase family protein [Owenweeksia sp.]|nr:glycosyltransferase family protein [Owenweeksia sp.]